MPIAANVEIREAAKRSGVKLWQIAENIGLSDATFSRKLRRELPEDERDRVLSVIKQLAMKSAGVS